ncbi:hypothetical protein B0T16DRAFT_170844 [Cercophora newfieldiana]|uniref:Secreted protein n=1 Tax=Cercophora newfieldiana TaxID=92897 RepID=A0AA40CRL0_9PEZI|nr:hypothetical protein B0T16DRAFT_170844 [Cercophora newfieldiana]
MTLFAPMSTRMAAVWSMAVGLLEMVGCMKRNCTSGALSPEISPTIECRLGSGQTIRFSGAWRSSEDEDVNIMARRCSPWGPNVTESEKTFQTANCQPLAQTKLAVRFNVGTLRWLGVTLATPSSVGTASAPVNEALPTLSTLHTLFRRHQRYPLHQRPTPAREPLRQLMHLGKSGAERNAHNSLNLGTSAGLDLHEKLSPFNLQAEGLHWNLT